MGRLRMSIISNIYYFYCYYIRRSVGQTVRVVVGGIQATIETVTQLKMELRTELVKYYPLGRHVVFR